MNFIDKVGYRLDSKILIGINYDVIDGNLVRIKSKYSMWTNGILAGIVTTVWNELHYKFHFVSEILLYH